MLYVSDIPVRTHVVVRRSCTTSIGRMIREQYNTTLAAVQHIGKPYYYSDYIRVFTIRTHVWFNNNNSNVYDITRPYCAAPTLANRIRISYKNIPAVYPGWPPFEGYERRDALPESVFIFYHLKTHFLFSIFDDARHRYRRNISTTRSETTDVLPDEFLTITSVLRRTFLPRP